MFIMIEKDDLKERNYFTIILLDQNFKMTKYLLFDI